VVRSRESVVRYVTTYCSKTLRAADFPDDDALDEAIRALHARRLCRTFGTWRGLQLTRTPVTGTWEIVGELAVILRDASNGDDLARRTLSALGTPAARQFLIDHPPRPPTPHDLPASTGFSRPLLFPDVFGGS
jgi:hypothetical protein